MSLHIAAKEGEIAEVVLLPGDPLRAKHIAETFLENPKQYTSIRNIFGYTGTYKGKKVSVQATGMGVPSISIYTHELITQYGVKKLIRVGTCGGMHEDVKIRDIVIAQGATTDSGIVRQIFGNVNFAPIADYELLSKAVITAMAQNIPVEKMYEQRQNFTIVALTGITGSGCSDFAELMHSQFIDNDDNGWGQESKG